MRPRPPFIAVALMFAAIGLILEQPLHADAFGSGTNTFAIDFVNIDDAGNAADTTGYGAVPYAYRMGKHEVSTEVLRKAIASGLNIGGDYSFRWTGNQPAAGYGLNWFAAAAFVNWLNTNSGYQKAYNIEPFEGLWIMRLWDDANAWTLGGVNLYRHKDAYYFLPNENEWYKSAYFNPSGGSYFAYPTGSSAAPVAVGSGTNAGTAVYAQASSQGPAGVDAAGGLSPYSTMGQGGNAWEWNETALGGENNAPYDDRVIRGGGWGDPLFFMGSSRRGGNTPYLTDVGFRVASVPEPSTYALLLMTGAGALWMARRRR
jgi:hypothetical protein